MRLNPLAWFVIKVLLLLPACYWAWYSASGFLSWVAAELTEKLVIISSPDLIYGIRQQGNSLLVASKVILPQLQASADKTGGLVFSINPLHYSFGMPLCIALILSSQGGFLLVCRNILISSVILLLVQVWGIYFDILKQLFLDISLAKNVTLSSTQLTMIAMGFQFGTMVLPSVTPLIIWIAFYRKFIVSLAPALRGIKP